jgi:hypothetical protein
MGRADLARQRLAEVRTWINRANPHDLPQSDEFAAWLHALLRENENVEIFAARSLELYEKKSIPSWHCAFRVLARLRTSTARERF